MRGGKDKLTEKLAKTWKGILWKRITKWLTSEKSNLIKNKENTNKFKTQWNTTINSGIYLQVSKNVNV
jgi:hypothetical protein